jgi:hypothetical protein
MWCDNEYFSRVAGTAQQIQGLNNTIYELALAMGDVVTISGPCVTFYDEKQGGGLSKAQFAKLKDELQSVGAGATDIETFFAHWGACEGRVFEEFGVEKQHIIDMLRIF